MEGFQLDTIYNEDCLIGMQRIPDGSVDCIITDPPYKYLKNQVLEVDFDEDVFFQQAKRVLKKDGMIVMFGRGTSFYRWNTILANIGFKFKEEIIWNKSYSTSPLMPLSRVHETVSIHTKGNGVVRRVKIPYLEMKRYDISKIQMDINRILSALGNVESLQKIKRFLEINDFTSDEINREDYEKDNVISTTISSVTKVADRGVATMCQMIAGMNEKSIIRDDYNSIDAMSKHCTSVRKETKGGERSVNTMNSICVGMNEKSIIEEKREHYSAIHPTQKPVRLIERLMNLVSTEGMTVLDPFMGSGTTAIAAIREKRHFLGFELNKEYFDKANERIKNELAQLEMRYNEFENHDDNV